MGSRIQAFDWSSTPLGPPDGWPEPLCTLVDLMLCSSQAMFITWGPERIMLYNDAYAPLCGDLHPWALGRSFDEVWADILGVVGPILDRAYAGESVHMDDIRLVVHRHGYPEETHFAFSYTPVRDGGTVAGMFCSCTETTAKMAAEKRRKFLLSLSDSVRNERDPLTIEAVTAELLGRVLGVAQVGYSEVDETAEWITIGRDWSDGRIPSVVGRHRISDFSASLTDALRSGRTIAVQDVRVDERTRSPETSAAFDALSIRAVLAVPLVKQSRLVATLFIHDAEPRIWSANDILIAEDVAERTWATVERARSETALRESEARFSNMADNAPVMIWVTNAAGYCTYLNRPWFTYTGQSERDALGHGWLEATHPEDRTELERTLRKAVTAREAIRVDYRLRRADGMYRWVLDVGSPRFDADGTFRGYVGSVIDIQERHEAEARQAFLMREVDHRAKNALAVVSSVVRLSRVENPADFVAAVDGRVAALARAHVLLAAGRWTGADLHTLATEELMAFLVTDRKSVNLSGPAVALLPDAVQPTAMILHELATNAVKHGALSVVGGSVDLSWTVTGAGDVRLDWRETGGPAVAGPPKRQGFGTRMLEVTSAQLGGTVGFFWERTGLHFTLTIAPENVGVPALSDAPAH